MEEEGLTGKGGPPQAENSSRRTGALAHHSQHCAEENLDVGRGCD
jgi:hypothetical protein